jgi:hypothetical protein
MQADSGATAQAPLRAPDPPQNEHVVYVDLTHLRLSSANKDINDNSYRHHVIVICRVSSLFVLIP